MDTLQDIVSDIRVFLYSGMVSLPLSLGGTMLLLGLFTGNYAMLFFLVGYLVMVPFVNFAINWVASDLVPEFMRAKIGDVCSIVVPFLTNSSTSPTYHIVSQWVAMISFFFGYIIHNSVALFVREPEPTGSVKLSEEKVIENERKTSYRKTQAMISLLTTIVFAFLLFIIRFNTGCESVVGMIIGIVVYFIIGYFWYNALSSIQQDRLSDLYGIANRLLPPGAIANAPVVCLPVEAS